MKIIKNPSVPKQILQTGKSFPDDKRRLDCAHYRSDNISQSNRTQIRLDTDLIGHRRDRTQT